MLVYGRMSNTVMSRRAIEVEGEARSVKAETEESVCGVYSVQCVRDV